MWAIRCSSVGERDIAEEAASRRGRHDVLDIAPALYPMRWRVVSEATILYESAAGVVTLTLNRPDKLNVFNEIMHGELARAFDRIEADPAIRAVLLTGAGRGFCAGQDLADRVTGEGDTPPDLGDTLERLYNPLIRRICRLERPVVCGVNGVAAG